MGDRRRAGGRQWETKTKHGNVTSSSDQWMLTSYYYMDEWVDVYRSGHMDVAYAR